MSPEHVKPFLGNLYYQQIDIDYWISALQQGQMLHFQGPCNGSPLLMTPYRSELSGILVTLYFINTLQDFTKESVLAQLPLYCDNFAAVLPLKTTTAPGVKSHLCPDYDVVSKVWSELKQVPNMIVSWVRAHQDDTKPM
eukprot:801736-Ditylum_brightwellii.AAC.1